MLSSFVKDGIGDVLWGWCCADSSLTVEPSQYHVMIMMIAAVTCMQDDYAL